MKLNPHAFLLCLCAILAPLQGAETWTVVPQFPQLEANEALGAVSGTACDAAGHVLVFHRGEPPVLVLSPTGKRLHSFGSGLFKSAHGLRVDPQDFIWVTDNGDHTVMKLDHQGKVLLTLGQKGAPGEDATHFNKPADIAFAGNGDIFVADGYGNSRVVKFDRNGRFLLAWGKKGKAAGEFNLPHAVQVDAEGRVYVGDRENDRVQVFDQQGKFLRQFGGFAPFGLFITPAQTLLVADGRANRVMKMSLEGTILSSWGGTGTELGTFQMPHGVTAGPDGSVYVTEIYGKRIQKFLPR